MKKHLYISLIAIFLFAACDKAEVQNAAQLAGKWEVNEFDGFYDGTLYECSIQADENREDYFFVNNFLDLISDPQNTDDNYRLRVKISGTRLIVQPQTVGDIEILDGTGSVKSENNFEIKYRYLTNGGGTFSATAIFIRILE
jgi:hypothetical protein